MTHYKKIDVLAAWALDCLSSMDARTARLFPYATHGTFTRIMGDYEFTFRATNNVLKVAIADLNNSQVTIQYDGITFGAPETLRQSLIAHENLSLRDIVDAYDIPDLRIAGITRIDDQCVFARFEKSELKENETS